MMHLLDVATGRRTAFVLALAVACSVVLWSERADHARVVVTDTETTILDVVEFEPHTATLRATSLPTLDAVAATLNGNPSIELVEVQSHTAAVGNPGDNQALSDQRAAVIVQHLVDVGVAPTRLVAQGYGDTQPIDRAIPAKNERVSFLILKRASDLDAP